MKTLPLLVCAVLLSNLAEAKPPDNWAGQSIGALKQGIEAKHPAAYYLLAAKLFSQGEVTRDEAIFWFYAGQLRFRYHLMANPQLPPSGDPALFASLSEVVGRPINEYAGGYPDKWIAAIDRALQWDAFHPNGFTPKAKAPDAYREIRSGYVAMRNTISTSKAQIRATRRQNGLQ
jgi:hypothetical protein